MYMNLQWGWNAVFLPIESWWEAAVTNMTEVEGACDEREGGDGDAEKERTWLGRDGLNWRLFPPIGRKKGTLVLVQRGEEGWCVQCPR